MINVYLKKNNIMEGAQQIKFVHECYTGPSTNSRYKLGFFF